MKTTASYIIALITTIICAWVMAILYFKIGAFAFLIYYVFVILVMLITIKKGVTK